MADDNWLRGIFGQVDVNRSGTISDTELQAALSNGNWKQFKINVVRLMVDMFDKDKSGTITFEEFKLLWHFINEWSKCFQKLDRDKSGTINKDELTRALATFGYRFRPEFTSVLMYKYDTEKKAAIDFDHFIHLCVTLHSLTGSFRNLDTDQDGVIDIDYEQFLLMAMSLR